MKNYLYYTFAFMFSVLTSSANAAEIKPFVDLLTWHASESNSAWAETITFPGNTTHIIQDSVSFNTRPGIKAGFLYSPESNFWNSRVTWTYWSSDSSKTIPNGPQIISSLFFSGSYFISGNVFVGASSNWQIAMNMLDIDIEHTFRPTPSLTLTPSIGLKGGSIDQQVRSSWNAIIFHATENVSSDYTGIGPSFGLNSTLNLYQNLNVVGNVSAALMYGRWNISDVYNRPAAIFITPTTISTSMTQSKLGNLMMDYFLGLQYTHQGRSRVTVELGYEMQYWANQLRLIAIQQLPPLGDLTIEGATCGISIDL
jgi:hypothetical protein